MEGASRGRSNARKSGRASGRGRPEKVRPQSGPASHSKVVCEGYCFVSPKFKLEDLASEWSD